MSDELITAFFLLYLNILFCRPLNDPYVCRPCECDKLGSLYEGICESEQDPSRGLVAGKCYCKQNVDGPNCNRW